jgi:hypothetical protein
VNDYETDAYRLLARDLHAARVRDAELERLARRLRADAPVRRRRRRSALFALRPHVHVHLHGTG